MVRSDEQRSGLTLRRQRRSGELVEQIGDVRGDVVVAGEEPQIGVLPAGAYVVVPRADVRVSLDHTRLSPHDHHDLRMVLQTDETAYDVPAGRLESARPADVHVFVEAGLHLDERSDLF